MSSIHEGKFYEVFQAGIQDRVYRRSKYQKMRSKFHGFYQQRESIMARH